MSISIPSELSLALIDAMTSGDFFRARELLEQGADPQTNRNLPLHLAVLRGRADLAKLLLGYGADVKYNKNSAICSAAENGHLTTVQLFLEHDPSLDIQDSLIMACRNGHVDTAVFLIQHDNRFFLEKNTLLQTAAGNGQKVMAQLLLSSGINVHAKHDQSLKLAIRIGDMEMVELLVSYGASVNIGLEVARGEKSPDILFYLEQVKRVEVEQRVLRREKTPVAHLSSRRL